MGERPRVLIEDWLPIAQIGAESQRERGASSALPPLYFLHVWWARRPLTVSRAAILGSLLPAWSEDWPSDLAKKFPTQDAYHDWFLKLIGIFGNPAMVRRAILRAKDDKWDLGPNPYGYKRAFTYNPNPEQIATMQALLRHTWGAADPGVMDCFAGGGSMPFESVRYGFTTYANELNPVASVILKATLDYPAQFGRQLPPLIAKYGKLWSDKVEERLGRYFPVGENESIFAYIWARTVTCPYTGKQIPLSPNWWLLKQEPPVAVRPTYDDSAASARFEVVEGDEACSRVRPERGTTSRKGPLSPWAHDQAVSWEHVRAEGRAGRLREQLYCVGLKSPVGLSFRSPEPAELAAASAAEEELARRSAKWLESGILPDEEIPVGQETHDHQYGILRWRDMFAPRQLLTLCTAAEVLRDVGRQIAAEVDPEVGMAVRTYLGLAFDKAADYNSRMVRWDSTRRKIVNTFDRHDFSLKWSHAEFDGAHNLLPWVVEQVRDACAGIAALVDQDVQRLFAGDTGTPAFERLTISQGSAASLPGMRDGSVGSVVIDPPYYDNVQYAECSDFFFVWMKRTLGDVYPALFSSELTSKDEEAVANAVRFSQIGGKKKALAEQDYERKMEACFREMHRVLKDDGVLTVMFTHKRVEAWDTLGTSLINAGFAVHSSWPVHTESEHSLHQAKKNAAASTILLTCRKRSDGGAAVWWDDLKSKVRDEARTKAAEYERLGIRGVDLYIATFGPVLSVISERWPVLTSEVDPKTNKPKPLRPEAALEIAREEVVSLRKKGLLLGREVRFDAVTDWYLLGWDAFRAEQFPGDEARKLCLALDVDLEDTIIKSKRLLAKRGKNVTFQLPKARRTRGMVDPDVEVFDCVLDAAHTAMLIFEEDGARGCERWVRQRRLDRDQRFMALLQAMANAIPVTKKKGEHIRPEIAVLDRMNDALGLGITFPVEPEPALKATQIDLFETPPVAEEGADHAEDEENEDLDEEDGDNV